MCDQHQFPANIQPIIMGRRKGATTRGKLFFTFIFLKMVLNFLLQRSVRKRYTSTFVQGQFFSFFLGNASKATTSREVEEDDFIEETSSELSYTDDPDWIASINQKFATSATSSESSHSESQQEETLCQAPAKPQEKSLKGTKNGGVGKRSKFASKKQYEKWDFFDPSAAFTSGVESDVRKPTQVQKITCYRKLIGNKKAVYLQYHSYVDKYGDKKKYPQIMYVNEYTLPTDQLKDPVNDNVSLKIIYFFQ